MTEPVPPTVRVAVAQPVRLDQTVTLTGTIAARTETDLSFRTSGRIVERLVDVGDPVRKGELLARLDTRTQVADLDSAKAGASAAEAQVRQAAAAFARTESLFGQGFTTRREFDQADRALKVAKANAASAQAQMASAEDALGYTELRADADGIVTARKLDAGETAQAAATVFTIAWDGPRDALFDIYENLLLLEGASTWSGDVTVALVAEPTVSVKGRLRQIAPGVDAQTATVRVKVGLEAVPAAMTLGAAVSGTSGIASPPVFVLPPAALTSDGGAAAVWVLDPGSGSVAPRRVHVTSYGTGTVVVDQGIAAGDQVVVDGTKLLRPGAKVTVAAETAPQ